MRKMQYLIAALMLFMVSCKKDETPTTNNNNNNNTTPADKRDMAVGTYNCRELILVNSGASNIIQDSAKYEIEIRKATDTTKIEIYKNGELLYNTSNVATLASNSKVLTFSIPAQTYRYLGNDHNVTGSNYFFTGSSYTHGGYIDSTKTSNFAITYPATTPGFNMVHRFDCVKK